MFVQIFFVLAFINSILCSSKCIQEGDDIICTGINQTFPNLGEKQYVKLTCKECVITNFTKDTFPFESNLIKLNVSNSLISSLGSKALLRLPKIQYLYFNKNSIAHIKPKAFYWSGISTPNNYFDEIDLSDNILEKLPANMFNENISVNYLNLNNNCIKNVDFFEHMFINLKKLLLANNQISYILPGTFKNFQNMYWLNLSKNKLKNFHFGIFQNLLNLKFLDISDNLLIDLPTGIFQYLQRLSTLDISGNMLVSLKPGTFYGLQSLSKLNLSNNNIKNFDTVFIQSINNFFHLDISLNLISNIDVKILKGNFPNLQNINIDKNLWFCDILASVVQNLHTKLTNTLNSNINYYNIKGIACINTPDSHDIFNKYLYAWETYPLK